MRHDAAKAVRPARTAPLAGARPVPRRGGRVVEGTGLENRQACKRLVGSNPTPSAIRRRMPSTALLPIGSKLRFPASP